MNNKSTTTDMEFEAINNNDIIVKTQTKISQLVSLNKIIEDLIILDSYLDNNKTLISKDKFLEKILREHPMDKYAEVIKKNMLQKINIVEQTDFFYKRLIFIFNSIYLTGFQTALINNCYGYNSELAILKDFHLILSNALNIKENKIVHIYDCFVDFIYNRLLFLLDKNRNSDDIKISSSLVQQLLDNYSKQ